MKHVSLYIIIVLFLLCFAVAFVEVTLNLKEQEISGSTELAWTFIFVVLVGMWVQRDSAGKKFDKPFDFGFFLYLFLPILLPYYLVRTRGVEGLVTFLGFAAIYYLPFFAGLVAYVYYA